MTRPNRISLGDGDVVITGIGLVSSLGDSASVFHEQLAAGTCAIGAPPWPTPDEVHSMFAGVQDFQPDGAIDPKVLDGTDRFAQFALVAAARALSEAELHEWDATRCGVVVGTSMGGITSLVEAQHGFDTAGFDGMSRKLLLRIWPNMAAAQIAIRYGLHGPSLTTCTACASSLDAIGTAARLVASGIADVMLSGGTEGWGPLAFSPAYAMAQHALGMFPSSSDPRLSCRPFDADRVGIVNGEGACIFVLEAREHAEARGARILASIRGYGSLAEAYHPSSPDPSGTWEAAAMRAAIDESGLHPQALIAHATGTPKGDSAEIRAVNAVFGQHASEVLVTSLKGAIGHCAGAAGAFNVAAAVMAMDRSEVVPTVNTTSPDAEAEFQIVVGQPARSDLSAVSVNAFGFGGQNASVVLGRQ
jgi:3-oxoacyl-[acyl-carrier-protein] synthase II